ncbi:MAG: glutamine synthetase type III [Epsilonproteobacteria bacterium]|nr:MAG: glutamine synthetase type III [Campylobacterota bacterium]RLA67369.1 MAG: glutamine synthetase type III [Campylobacterota bacterium]
MNPTSSGEEKMTATMNSRNAARMKATDRTIRRINIPTDGEGKSLKISDYYAENVFDYRKSDMIPQEVKIELKAYTASHSAGKSLSKEHAEVVAKAVGTWAMRRGATHFCHWFQPLTGSTAEKHDSFLSFSKDDLPIVKLGASALLQGEPDASSFPNGGSRSTFEARGYTSWDLSSPLFLREGENGKTLCIPTAFISYTGDALDIKTPHLRSITALDKAATKFMKVIGKTDTEHVYSNCGCEQEYFLIDKAMYILRPDLVMTGRTLFGSLTSRNQQLSDHYFGTVPERVLAFMQELDYKLHRLGIPSKTRHNEVAPGQYELAPIFEDSNLAADHNQLLMAVIKKVAEKHNFVGILHEKPFAGVNGSGKHLNWSMSDNTGHNLLEPGQNPQDNYRFLAMVSCVVEAVKRNSKALRMAIASHGNDHRLGANEAPPSIISVYLGETLDKIYDAILEGKDFVPSNDKFLESGAGQLAHLLKDNTDRNRTSPFAFTGNKFEFRAVGSSQAVGFPSTILNAAMSEVLNEATVLVESYMKDGKSTDEALLELIRHYMGRSNDVVFGGDGYSSEWVVEAKKRGLPNLRTTPDALGVLKDSKLTSFLTEQGIFRGDELETRYNVAMENYCMLREIEFQTLVSMVNQNVLSAGLDYKLRLAQIITAGKSNGLESSVETDIYKRINMIIENLYDSSRELDRALEALDEDIEKRANALANNLLPLSEKVADNCNALEEMVPDDLWQLPKYYDMLFLR